MEERLWNYIDGTCDPEERDLVTSLIEQDDSWRKAYHEMLQFNKEILAITPDEPSMAFGYNVMEGIRAMEASKPLKTTINKHIITGIAAFFGISIIALLLFLMTGVMQNVGNGTSSFNIKFPGMSALMDSAAMKVFFYIDAMLLMLFADAWLRKSRNAKIKSVQN